MLRLVWVAFFVEVFCDSLRLGAPLVLEGFAVPEDVGCGEASDLRTAGQRSH